MSRIWLGAIVGVIAYVFFLAIQAPADWVINRVQQQIPGLVMTGITGSMWSGEAVQVNYQDQHIEQVSWKFNPLTVLQGCLGYRVNAKWQGQPMALNAGTKWNKQPCISSLEGRFDLNSLLSNSNLPVQLAGAIELDIDTVVITEGNQFPLFSGSMRWPEASMQSPMSLGLGDVSLEIHPDGDEMMRGQLVAEGGELTIDGPIDITRDGDFSIDMAIRSSGEPSEEIQAGLGAFAEYHDGVYHLEYSDNIYSLLQ